MLLNLEQYFLWFCFYSIIGWIYESIICSIDAKRPVNRGFLNGPYCPIYGCGAVLVILFLGRVHNPVLLFFLSALLTCTLEYITSYLMEKLFHARWWDYSNKIGNINGRVCLLGAVVFGAFSVLLLKVFHPMLVNGMAKLPPAFLHTASVLLTAVFITDICVTCSGMAGFNEKLREFSDILEQAKSSVENRIHTLPRYEKMAAVHEHFLEKLNKQQLRMIHTFPKLTSIHYNQSLSELRSYLHSRRKK